MDKNFPFHIRPMGKDDIAQVTDVDREAFPTQWPPTDFHYELKNRLAHYIVVCDETRTVEEPSTEVSGTRYSTGLLARLRQILHLSSISSAGEPEQARYYLVGYAGFWVMADEAHITSIAVRQTYSRRGIGEFLLTSVIDMACELKASVVTLEVRVSNIGAQSLYTKYGFAQVGLRRGYYVDRGPRGDSREDGFVMTTEAIDSASFQTRLGELKKAHTRKWGISESGGY